MAHAQRPSQTQQRPAQQAPWDGKKVDQLPAKVDGANGAKAETGEKPIEFTPLGEHDAIVLTFNLVRDHLTKPTRRGSKPTTSDILKFLKVCQTRKLNPYADDCWLVGYDSDDGPTFNVIVAIQALLKRADVAKTATGDPAFEGIESGVVVVRDGEVIERPGDLTLDGETLIGGWARVYRTDRRIPFYQRLKLSSYDKKRSVWKTDPAGQISKCAEAAALRQAFPSDVAGLYLAGEFDMFGPDAAAAAGKADDRHSAAQALKDRMLPRQQETVVGKAMVVPESTQELQEAPGEHDHDDAPQGREPGDDEGESGPAAEAAEESATQPVMFGGK